MSILVKWLIVVGCGLGISAIPLPEGVTRESWTLLSIFIATIVGSIVQPLPGSAMVLLGVVAVTVFRALPIEKALERLCRPVRLARTGRVFYLAGNDQNGPRPPDRADLRSPDRPQNARASAIRWYLPILSSLRSSPRPAPARAALSCPSPGAFPKPTIRGRTTAPPGGWAPS